MHVRRRMTTNINMKQLTLVTSIHFSYAPSHKMREKRKEKKITCAPFSLHSDQKDNKTTTINHTKSKGKTGIERPNFSLVGGGGDRVGGGTGGGGGVVASIC